MRPTTPLALLGLLTLAGPALAQDPEFRGPAVHDGAWATTRSWSDPAAGGDDRSQGTLAYAYREWAARRAQEHEDGRTLLDCADLSIDMIVEYAASNGLPIEWRVWYPPERRYVVVRNTDRQFASVADFSAWSKHFLGAINLADNTAPISYEEWAGGDMVLMNWNQSEEEPNFPGRVVWHTYLIGAPDELIFYGNMNDGLPLPVVSTSSPSTFERVRAHPDRYGLSPRRFAFMASAVRGPEVRVDEVVVRATSLNLREGPGTAFAVTRLARTGERLPVLGRQGLWVKVSLADGREAWGHAAYLRGDSRWEPAPPATEPAVTAEAPGSSAPTDAPTHAPATTGLASALPGS